MKKTTLILGLAAAGCVALLSSCGQTAPETPYWENPESLKVQADIVKTLSALPNAEHKELKSEKRLQSVGDPIVAGGKEDNAVPEGQPVEIEDPKTSKGPLEEVNGIPGHWVTTTHKYKITQAYDEQILKDPHTDIMYPHCVLNGESVLDGTFAPITLCPTGPTTFSITKVADSYDDAKEVKETVAGNIRMSDYLTRYSKWANLHMKAPALVSMHSIEIVNNQTDVATRLGLNVANEIFKLNSNFGLNMSYKRNHILARFVQRAFSAIADFPKTATVFAQFTPGVFKSKPVYVSSITYGRMAYIAIETNSDLVDVQAALEFTLKKNQEIPVDLGIDTETKVKKIIENSNVSVVIVGGTNEQQREFVTGPSIETFRKFMVESVNMNEVVPVNFQLRYVHDNSLARVVATNEYSVTTQEFIPEFKSISLEMSVAGFILSGDIDKTNELMGEGYMLNGPLDSKELVPTEDSKPIKIFEIQDWVRYKGDGKTFNKFYQGSKLLVIKRKEGESIEDFLKRRITLVTDLKEKNPFRVIPYGKGYYEMSIAQLISVANSSNPQFTVTSRNKNYIANTRYVIRSIQYRKGKTTIYDGNEDFHRDINNKK